MEQTDGKCFGIADNTSYAYDQFETVEDKLVDAPYYAFKMNGVAFASMAGVTVDDVCHITKTDGSITPNLYAAGEMCSNNLLQGRYAGSGSQIGAGLYEGKIIADQITEELK